MRFCQWWIKGILAIFVTTLDLENAAATSDDYHSLFNAQSLECVFTQGISGRLKESGVELEELASEELRFKVTHVDLQNKTAQMTRGKADDREVRIFRTPIGLTIIELLTSNFDNGNLVVSTVFANNTDKAEMMAVHSRHMAFSIAAPNDVMIASQLYGRCKVLQ